MVDLVKSYLVKSFFEKVMDLSLLIFTLETHQFCPAPRTLRNNEELGPGI
jgi:hypothetical protein